MVQRDFIYRHIGGDGMLVSCTTREWWWWPPKKDPTPPVGADTFSIRVIDGDRVEVDAAACLGPNGTVRTRDWSGTSTGGAVKRLGPNGTAAMFALPGSGTTTMTCTVTDNEGNKRVFTRLVPHVARKFVSGRIEWRSSRPDGAAYTHDITFLSPAATRMRIVWEQVSGPKVTLTQSVWDWSPTAQGQELNMSLAYRTPTSITGAQDVLVWRARISFPDQPTWPDIQSRALSHELVGTPQPVSALKFSHDFPAKSWTRTLASQHPLAPTTQTTVKGATVAPKADIEADFRAQIARRGVVNVGVGDYGSALYRVNASTPRTRVKWDNWQTFDYQMPNYYDGDKYFMDVPFPAGAPAAPGTDSPIMFYDPSSDTSWEFWRWRLDETGQPVASSGGRIRGLYAGTGQSIGFSVSASALNLAATHMMVDEVQRALAAYDRNNPAKWDSIVGHVLTLAIWEPRRWDRFGWPALQSDGNNDTPSRPWIGQRFSIDPNLDLATLPLTPFGHIVARACQKYGAMVTETAGAVSIGAQAGFAHKMATGVDPWSAILAGQQTYQVLGPVPATAWRAHKIVTSAAEWQSTVGDPKSETTTPPTTPTPTPTPTPTLPFTDRKNVAFTGGGQTSKIHTFAAGRKAGDGLLVWLHGDAAYEFNNPDVAYVLGGTNGVRAACAARGIICVAALSPDTSGTVTWWESGMTRANYVKALLDEMQKGFATKPGRVILAGHSGGAQQTTQFFMRAYPDYFSGGGMTFVTGGGEAPDVSTTHSAATKSKLAMHWAVGSNDTAANAGDGFDGLAAARAGEAYFRGKGFTRTSIQVISGKPHDIGDYRTPLLAQIDKHLPQ